MCTILAWGCWCTISRRGRVGSSGAPPSPWRRRAVRRLSRGRSLLQERVSVVYNCAELSVLLACTAYTSVCVFVCLLVILNFIQLIYVFIYLFIYLFVYLFIYWFIYLFIYLFILALIYSCVVALIIMTSAVDWALNANYVYVFTWLFILFIFVTMWLIVSVFKFTCQLVRMYSKEVSIRPLLYTRY